MKIVTVVGARPQFIKAAMVSRVLKSNGIQEIIIHTGQHYDDNMSKVFFEQMSIPDPQYNLHIQECTHGAMTGKMLAGIEAVLTKEMPDMVVVFGDTNSTLAGALASRKLNIPVAHVEGGLRNFDFTIPEDVNRTLTDRISSIIFCPTDTAVENLLKEGFASFDIKVVRTGDLMADSVFYFSRLVNERPDIIDSSVKALPEDGVLVTIHRQETTKPAVLSEVVGFLNDTANSHQLIFPIHPRTRKVLQDLGDEISTRIHVIEPVGYLEMQYILSRSSHVITDSGGLQKEAYLHGKKSLLLMDFTPWVELVSGGYSITASLTRENLNAAFQRSLNLDGDFSIKLYGEGNASEEIVNEILNYRTSNEI